MTESNNLIGEMEKSMEHLSSISYWGQNQKSPRGDAEKFYTIAENGKKQKIIELGMNSRINSVLDDHGSNTNEEMIVKGIMDEGFPELRVTYNQIKEAWRVPAKRDTNKNTRYILYIRRKAKYGINIKSS